jgi:hypothetical protein
MAVKAYYGRGARTFGNPDGALTGGGAYAAGGTNPNGPNQGGGGGGGGTQLVFQLTASGGPNSTGPYTSPPSPNNCSWEFGYATGAPDGPIFGGVAPDPATVNGNNIVCFGTIQGGPGGPPAPSWVTLCLSGAVLQTHFTNISFTDTNAVVHLLTTASADFNTTFSTPGFSVWSWPWPDGFGASVQTNSDITVNW